MVLGGPRILSVELNVMGTHKELSRSMCLSVVFLISHSTQSMEHLGAEGFCSILVNPLSCSPLCLSGKASCITYVASPRGGEKKAFSFKENKQVMQEKIHFFCFVPNAVFIVSFKKAEGMEIVKRALSHERDSLHNLISGDFTDVPEVPCQKVEFVQGKYAP